MRPYLTLISGARFFIIPWLLLVVTGLIVISSFSVSDIHVAINARHNDFMDWLMPFATLAGDGWTIAVLIVLLIAWNRRAGIITAIACVIPSLITQLLKSTVFYGEPRPKLYFTTVEIKELHYVPGVENWLFDSFPSGHTTVAFAFFFAASLLLRNRLWSLLFFALAFTIGYSRIYLSQHFTQDVVAGAVIGTICSLIVCAEAQRFRKFTFPATLHENK